MGLDVFSRVEMLTSGLSWGSYLPKQSKKRLAFASPASAEFLVVWGVVFVARDVDIVHAGFQAADEVFFHAGLIFAGFDPANVPFGGAAFVPGFMPAFMSDQPAFEIRRLAHIKRLEEKHEPPPHENIHPAAIGQPAIGQRDLEPVIAAGFSVPIASSEQDHGVSPYRVWLTLACRSLTLF